MDEEPTPEKIFCFVALVAQFTRGEELDLASLAHGKTRRLEFAFENDKIRVRHEHSVAQFMNQRLVCAQPGPSASASAANSPARAEGFVHSPAYQ